MSHAGAIKTIDCNIDAYNLTGRTAKSVLSFLPEPCIQNHLLLHVNKTVWEMCPTDCTGIDTLGSCCTYRNFGSLIVLIAAGGFTHALHLRFGQSQGMQSFTQHPFVEETMRGEAYNACDGICQIGFEVWPIL